ncbi:HD domain-containing phosphohydrolase [Aeromonas diversa]|uniref:HD domain-containing phosphohydrolase n=1 Tax=Aeromonas diversa TaxID=502790 RepID=UPI0039A04CD5
MSTSLPYRRPFYLHIASLFFGLFAVIGGLLLFQQYRQTRDLAVEHQRESFSLYRQQLNLALQQNLVPARTSLSLLQAGQLPTMGSLAERLTALPQLAKVLEGNPGLAAVYAGYDDGDFFLVRPLDRQVLARLGLSAPGGSRLLVQSRAGGEGLYLFFDLSLSLLEQRAMPGYDFDPRSRNWFNMAKGSTDTVVTRPYLFYSTREPGVTLALRAGRAVLGIDGSVHSLSEVIGRLPLPEGGRLALIDDEGHLLAADRDTLLDLEGAETLPDLTRMPAPFVELAGHLRQGEFELVSGGNTWFGSLARLSPHSRFSLVLLVPDAVLTRAAVRQAWHSVLLGGLVLLFLLPAIWLVARSTARPLQALTLAAQQLRRFDFGGGALPGSTIKEIDELSVAISGMKQTLCNFIAMGRSLSAERQLESLLDRMLQESVDAVDALGGAILLAQERGYSPVRGCWGTAPRPAESTDALLARFSGEQRLVHELTEPLWQETLAEMAPYPGPHWLVMEPLCNVEHTRVGLLVLILPYCDHEELASRLALIEALAGSAASAIETRRLLEEQKRLLSAFIELIAGAIDAKSPYTGGHCQRVPELTRMLTQAACDQSDGPFAGFALTEEQWEAVHIASWLHDCGKVTTPEFVVDKATKLETLYDRIHEIRTRFEVLKRDAYIEALSARLAEEERERARAEAAPRWSELDEEFAFVAECNLGSEGMDPARLERLTAIAARTWLRTLDDGLGLSHEERARRGERPAPPCFETLLADKPEHRIVRPEEDRLDDDNPWGFRVKVPEWLYNRGELYNLSVMRGTLTEEERYKINEHIIQTIRMLRRLPFPGHLAAVPEMAGGHHEKMDGTGYPCGLKGEQMSVPARIMAIADVFEALTASDRPYKSGKTLSQSLAILRSMAAGGHLDPDLYRLFLESGVWRDYGVRFLRPEQQDSVDLAALRLPEADAGLVPS